MWDCGGWVVVMLCVVKVGFGGGFGWLIGYFGS